MEEAAKQLKEEGNECFREKRYNKAVQLYTASLEKHLEPVVLGNRAQSYLNLNHYEHTIMDCNRSLQLDPLFIKALFRRASALEAMGLYSQARKDLERLLKISNDVAAKTALKRIKNKSDVTSSIGLKVCEKGDEVRSDEPFQDVFIECDSVEDEEKTSLLTESESEDGKRLPGMSFSPPKTYSDFLTDFSLLRNYPLSFAEYFLKIGYGAYGSLFDDVLDPDVVSCFLKGLIQLLAQQRSDESIRQTTKSLLLLTEVSRFDIVPLFLSAGDKQNLQRICDLLPKLDAEMVLTRFSS